MIDKVFFENIEHLEVHQDFALQEVIREVVTLYETSDGVRFFMDFPEKEFILQAIVFIHYPILW